MRNGVTTVVCAALLGVAGSAGADISYPNFSSTAGLSLAGSAGTSGTALRLTGPGANLAGGAWYSTRQNIADGFTTTFTFQVSGLTGSGGDGFTFTVQNAGTGVLGATGCGQGYHGIVNSLAVEFDTRQNSTCNGASVGDPDGNHVAVHTLGVAANSAGSAARLGSSSVIPNLSDGAVHTGRVVYQNGQLIVYIDDLVNPRLTVAVDLANLLALESGALSYVGFTAATSSSATENHDIRSWTFTEIPPASGNHRPAVPVITEPSTDGKILSPSDAHMETSDFVDQDAGDTHVCTDWEIWTMSPSERVWVTACIDGVEILHTHLGDGVFLGSHAGRSDLKYSTNYRLRVRHRDSSGDPLSEWSFWSNRTFSTGAPGTLFAMRADDIDDPPAPTWRTESNTAVVLPPGATPPSMTLGSASGQTLITVAGLDGVSNAVTNPDHLPSHVDVRVRISGGSTGVTLPASNFRFLHDCEWHTVYLPAATVNAGQSAYYWVSENGSTFVGTSGQTQPSFATLARSSPVPWVVLEPGYEVEVFATGLRLPVNIAFIPNAGTGPNDPYLYVTELYGTIKTVTRSGAASNYATNLLNFNPTGAFPGSGEQGLAGIAVDAGTGDVYAGMLYDSAPPNGAHYPKVVKFTSTDGGRTAATQTTILAMPGETQGQSHFISNFSFGPDGKLYVHMGDGFSTGTGQDLNSFRGKILRMNLDGSACTDNPFYDAGNGITARDYVYLYGIRNPFGGAWRSADGAHYTIENGPSVDRFTKGVVGRNYLWDGSDASMNNFAIFTYSPANGPVNVAFMQPETFGGSGFPVDKMDKAFISESGPTWATGPQTRGKRLVYVTLDAAGNRISGPTTLVEYNGTGKATCVGLAAGPDGLYFTDLYKDLNYSSPIDTGANLFRLRYRPPTDCNNNGEPDWCDLAMGESIDSDGDGILDECECLADYNNDNFVDGLDSDAFNNDFESTDPVQQMNADVNGDGFVDGIDYDVFNNAFDAGC